MAVLAVLLGSTLVYFTLGYLSFHWGGPYKYELWYYPSPVSSTPDSVASLGILASIALPVVVFLALLFSPEIIRRISSNSRSTEHNSQ